MSDNNDLLIQLMQSQSNVLTQIAIISGDTKGALKELVTSQELHIQESNAEKATAIEFRSRTFNTLVAIIVVLVLIISGLLVHMNVKGGEVIGEAVKKIAPIVTGVN